MEDDFVIFNGVPLPANKRKGQTPYPWSQLEIGQSFFIPAGRCKPSSCSSLCSGANKRYYPKRFAWRQHSLDNGSYPIEGAMIWRTK